MAVGMKSNDEPNIRQILRSLRRSRWLLGFIRGAWAAGSAVPYEMVVELEEAWWADQLRAMKDGLPPIAD